MLTRMNHSDLQIFGMTFAQILIIAILISPRSYACFLLSSYWEEEKNKYLPAALS